MKKIILFSVSIVALASCHDYPDFDDLSYKPVVITNHDPSIDFDNYQTYYMSDSITKISDDPNDSILEATYGDPLSNAIVENMNSRGFVRVGLNDNPDLGLNTAVIKITTTVQTYPPYYWWGYPGYGGCYYGYCGGYYPYYGYGYGYSYSYSTGSLMIQMADLKNVNDSLKKINIVWTNFNTGVLGSSSTLNVQEGVNSINQAFTQSTYLETNN
jgi:hypothetical protein